MAAGKARKKIVIDTDVLVSAQGMNSYDYRSDRCLAFLKAVLSICHHVVATDEIRNEWDRHISDRGNAVTRIWIASMTSRGKVAELDAHYEDGLRRAIAELSQSVQEADELYKDVHLLEACRGQDADLIIASNDNNARASFARYIQEIGWLGKVIWVNPATDLDLVEWLDRGAPSEQSRQLATFSVSQP